MRRAEESLLNHSPENPNDFVLLAPFTGPMVPLADVPDPVFA
ncbi:MAG: multiphosphoryl transfer protein, partial [Caballeronia sp.]|nr:multiphosphoryl transfer protein [Caballeronia sp.]